MMKSIDCDSTILKATQFLVDQLSLAHISFNDGTRLPEALREFSELAQRPVTELAEGAIEVKGAALRIVESQSIDFITL